MIKKLETYEHMKDSGVPWLGDIPEHWKIERAKSHFNFTKVLNKKRTNTNVLSLTLRGVVKNNPDSPEGMVPKDYATYQIFKKNDLVFKLIDLENYKTSRVGLVPEDGIMSSAYIRFTPKIEKTVGYFYHYFYDLYTRGVYNQLGAGVRSTLGPTDLGKLQITVPTIEEQDSIMLFLNWIHFTVDKVLKAKRKTITHVLEQKKVIINKAITTGTDQNSSINEKPLFGVFHYSKSFTKTKLGRLCTSVRDGTHNPPPATAGIHRLLSVRNIINGKFVTRVDDRTMTPQAFSELQRSYTVEEGDIVIAIVGGTTGKSAVVEKMENVTVQRSLGILRPNRSIITSEYLGLLIQSELVQSQIRQTMIKYAAQPGIYLNDLSNLVVLYPDLKKQREIIKQLENDLHPLNQALDKMRRETDLLIEYRNKLCSDAVTGKINVTNFTPHLSNIVDQNITSEEIDLSINTETEDGL